LGVDLLGKGSSPQINALSDRLGGDRLVGLFVFRWSAGCFFFFFFFFLRLLLLQMLMELRSASFFFFFFFFFFFVFVLRVDSGCSAMTGVATSMTGATTLR
jgi:hypothetical protein